MSGIFISYRRDDTLAYANRLCADLQGEFGKGRVFMDITNLEGGSRFVEAIERKVASCNVVIALIGSSWLVDQSGRRRLDNAEDMVRREIATALNNDVRIIPLVVFGAAMPREEDLPDDIKRLAKLHALQLTDIYWQQDIKQLMKALPVREDTGRSAVKYIGAAGVGLVAAFAMNRYGLSHVIGPKSTAPLVQAVSLGTAAIVGFLTGRKAIHKQLK